MMIYLQHNCSLIIVESYLQETMVLQKEYLLFENCVRKVLHKVMNNDECAQSIARRPCRGQLTVHELFIRQDLTK